MQERPHPGAHPQVRSLPFQHGAGQRVPLKIRQRNIVRPFGQVQHRLAAGEDLKDFAGQLAVLPVAQIDEHVRLGNLLLGLRKGNLAQDLQPVAHHPPAGIRQGRGIMLPAVPREHQFQIRVVHAAEQLQCIVGRAQHRIQRAHKGTAHPAVPLLFRHRRHRRRNHAGKLHDLQLSAIGRHAAARLVQMGGHLRGDQQLVQLLAQAQLHRLGVRPLAGRPAGEGVHHPGQLFAADGRIPQRLRAGEWGVHAEHRIVVIPLVQLFHHGPAGVNAAGVVQHDLPHRGCHRRGVHGQPGQPQRHR